MDGYEEISILCVEDEDDARELLLTTLKHNFPDLRLLSAGNGLEGLALCGKHHPRILLTDILMPGINGIELSTEIRRIVPNIVIIVMSAHSEVQYLLKAIEIGVNHFVLKPLNLSHLMGIVNRSITTIRLEDQVRIQAEDLAAANNELETFNYTVSHDLRLPLTVVGGFAQLLLDKIDPAQDPESSSYLEAICQSVTRMEELIDSLLELSRITHRELELNAVNLSDLATSISRELKIRDPERRVHFTIADNISCKGDQVLLRLVLENLLGNAWKYTSRRDEASIEFGMAELGDDIAFMVRDNGAGFDGRKADDIFRCFHRLHCNDEFSGQGIGLATVKRIIDRHGGTIRAEGEVNKGATFYVTLPTLTGG